MDYPIKITLQRPVTVDGETTSELVFDELDLGTSIEIEEAETGGEQTLIMLAGMSGVDRSIIRKVKECDYIEIRKRVLVPYHAEVNAREEADSGNVKAAK